MQNHTHESHFRFDINLRSYCVCVCVRRYPLATLHVLCAPVLLLEVMCVCSVRVCINIYVQV